MASSNTVVRDSFLLDGVISKLNSAVTSYKAAQAPSTPAYVADLALAPIYQAVAMFAVASQLAKIREGYELSDLVVGMLPDGSKTTGQDLNIDPQDAPARRPTGSMKPTWKDYIVAVIAWVLLAVGVAIWWISTNEGSTQESNPPCLQDTVRPATHAI